MSNGETERMDVGVQADGTATQGAGYDGRALMQAQLMSKNTGIAAILAFFFGGFGLLYASIPLGIVCSIIEVIMLIVVFVTFGIGIVFYIPWHILCIIVALVLVSRHNKRLLEAL